LDGRAAHLARTPSWLSTTNPQNPGTHSGIHYSICPCIDLQSSCGECTRLTLRVGGAGDYLLGAEDGGLAVVGEDSDASLQHPHGGKGVAAAACS